MSAPLSHDPLTVTLKDNSVWRRRAVTDAGLGLYAVEGSCQCPEYLLVSLAELAVHGIQGMAHVLPVPVGLEPRTLDTVEDELTGVSLSLYEEELTSERLRWALASAKRGRARLRARVAELEAATDGCSCPPADHPHQVGCPLDGVPDRLTQSFAPVAALREDVSPQVERLRNLLAGQRASLEDPHDGPLAHPYRLSHDLPELGGAS